MNDKVFISVLGLVLISWLIFSAGDKQAVQKTGDLKNFVQKLDTKIPEILKKFTVTGAAIAIVHQGDILWSRGYGWANQAKEIKVTADTMFQAASISKSVTAWAVMKLVEENKIGLEDPVNQFLTRWEIPDSGFDLNKVTVRRLLNHTAGLSLGGFPGFHPGRNIPGLEEALSGENSSNIAVELIKEPGLEFDYSGGGYTLLSLLIEEVTGDLFENYIKREVLKPLGMNRSTYKWDDVDGATLAVGYKADGESLPNYIFSTKGAASLYTSVNDLGKFVAAAMGPTGNHPVGRQVLKPGTLELMLSDPVDTRGDVNLFFDKMGLGYFIDSFDGNNKMVAHTGSNRGWRNIFVFFPQTKDGLVILTNSNNGRNAYIQILNDWSNFITGNQPKMCGFFEKISRISLITALILIIGFLVNLIVSLKSHRFRERKFVFKIKSFPWWKLSLRMIIYVLIPVLGFWFWYQSLSPLLSDLSPLTAPWVNLGFLFWIINLAFTGLFLKKKEKTN